MIERYSRPEMTNLWKAETQYATWLDVELAALEGLERIGSAPAGSATAVRQRARIDVNKIRELERETRHEVIAFLRSIEEAVGDGANYLHFGMTSSDVVDTALAITLSRACEILLDDLETLSQTIKARAIEHRHTLCLGRTHGRGAEPTTFGLKLMTHYCEVRRNIHRLRTAKAGIEFCKVSGAVGTYATVDPAVERYVAEAFGLAIEPVTGQAVPRDRHAMLFLTFAMIASAIERLAVEIRHLQFEEVDEIREPFWDCQQGSSAMPHKRNPILCENVTGLSRLIRSVVNPGLEDIVLWHERDITHSSVERVLFPTATILLDFVLHRLDLVIANIEIDSDRMRQNLERQRPLFASQNIMLTLIRTGLTRQQAYERTQRAMMNARAHLETMDDLAWTCIGNDLGLKHCELSELGNVESFLDKVNLIFDRAMREAK